MSLPEDVGRRIAEVRVQRGWTQEECAVRLQLTVRRLRRFEAGANVTLHTLERIAYGLGVAARSLLDPPASHEPPRVGRPRKEARPVPSPSPYERHEASIAHLHELTVRGGKTEGRRARPVAGGSKKAK